VVKVRTPISGVNDCRGFTLLELLLVCALIALAAGLTAPLLSNTDQKQFRVDLRQIAAHLNYSRRQAVITGAEQEVKLATRVAEEAPADAPLERPPAWINEGMSLRYAATLDDPFEETDELVVIFFPMGSSTGGLIELADSERRAYLYISQLTGKLLVESRLADLEARIEEETP